MKVRLRRPSTDALIRDALNRIRIAHPHGLPNIEALKRSISLEAVISFHLEDDPDTSGREPRWHCPFHHDTNPSLWAHDDHQGTGVGRWGCNPCGISGDVYDFLERLHHYTKAEAITWVKVWHNNHRSIRIRLRRRP